MREITFGTQNKAKVDQINGGLSGTDISVVGIPEGTPKIEVEENGKTALENAHKKATAYAKQLGKIVFAMDNALYFKDLPTEEQPGLHVRRFRDKTRPNDSEMIAYYKDLISKIGGPEVDGWWEFGICIANPNGSCNETTIISPRKFVINGGEKMVETQQASGGGLVGFAIIFLIILLIFPAFAIWLLYVAIVVMLIAGLVSLIAG